MKPFENRNQNQHTNQSNCANLFNQFCISLNTLKDSFRPRLFLIKKKTYWCHYIDNALITSYLGRVGFCRPFLPHRSTDIDSFNLKDFLKSRAIKQNELKKGECGDCCGCSFLNVGYHDKNEWVFNSIDLAFSSFCNLRCTYCYIPKPDLAIKNYDKEEKMFSLICEILDHQLLNPYGSVSFSGGEPTLMSSFSKTCRKFFDYSPNLTFAFITNCTIVSKDIVEIMKTPSKVSFMISIDSGNEDSYLKIKGKPFFQHVMRNLQYYLKIAECYPNNNIRVKYILLPENLNDFIDFLNIMAGLKLETVYFDLDANLPTISDEMINAAIDFCIEAKNAV
ncbi:radical SAM protein [uncultured Methanospirillum sp.]|uniref:radical SAM protein n=1 Tax=uncultured Methanospirillum sp. TaxID=262503 RepID=UPI0029C694F4|nr:radical SAM protein [uncultured Methanospirillum sp.]